jgi:hypothetical protein
VAPDWPCVNNPSCALVTVRSGIWTIDVTSAAVSFGVNSSPPPLTVAPLITLGGAFGATSTVSVMAG